MSSVELQTTQPESLEDKPDESQYLLRRFFRNKMAVLGLFVFLFMILIAIFAPLLAPYDHLQTDLSVSLQTPSSAHWFGTDEFGRDILSRILFGARVSLMVGVIAVGISFSLGTTLGLIAGYIGGVWDDVIMRFTDILLAFPSILLAIAIMTGLGRGVGNAMIAIGIVGIPVYARIVRGQVLAVRSQEYVEAAKSIGAGSVRQILRHILPNVVAPLIVQISLGMSTAILEAASLGFLGLGVQPPQAEWGDMIAHGRRFINNAAYMIYFPGIAISLTVLGLNLFGDGLRDILDPRLKK
ncbi:ABC transporter permease [Desulfosporosinus metallidurans]|uniref:Dipeptide transport system permease protein DppC n=1 Tax=Desulfosporosinus metallidurans TaxID=1888891 RepID=A0A1Q8R2S5_9FIRM|nr:ABC transporter permease [Desulfosporosinus metallidurans]OLN33915.1 Dipeptide transport system permease protein DppC [Desulfosporosinus metallidurans]